MRWGSIPRKVAKPHLGIGSAKSGEIRITAFKLSKPPYFPGKRAGRLNGPEQP
jgi:hypothetical protein